MADNDGKEIVSSSFIVGGSSVITAVIGIIKMKAVAILLGPAGIGLIGLFQNLMAVMTQVSSVGVGNSGTREIARSLTSLDKNSQYLTRKSIFWLGIFLAALGGMGVLVFGGFYISMITESEIDFLDLLILAAGVFLGVAAAPQGAVLAGVREIGSIARVRVFSSLFSSLAGVGLIYFLGESGIVAFVMVAPLANFFFMWFFARKVKIGLEGVGTIKEVFPNFAPLMKQGGGFMASGLFMAIGLLIIRFIYKEEVGVEGLGFMQAAWVISASYLGLVFSSMGTNYFPKLSGLVNDRKRMQELINLQAEITLLFSAPLILFMVGFSDFVISILYTEEFGPASDILGFQLVGDVFKLASWPLGFVLLAAGMSTIYMYKGFLIVLVFVTSVYFLIPDFGFLSVGIAYVFMHAVNLVILILLLALRFGFFYSFKVWVGWLYLLASSLVLSMCSFYSLSGSIYLAASLFVVTSSYSIYRLNSIVGVVGKIKSKLRIRYE